MTELANLCQLFLIDNGAGLLLTDDDKVLLLDIDI
jgi:hypothetical protein